MREIWFSSIRHVKRLSLSLSLNFLPLSSVGVLIVKYRQCPIKQKHSELVKSGHYRQSMMNLQQGFCRKVPFSFLLQQLGVQRTAISFDDRPSA
ncbi:hypothetical protein CDAR_299371 [Caerostris darwini]|uniref:Uncharacterized protein n=1 Tax=Caerostris darwini TaxID=1538125 RepID=A0AAV4RNR0_9ARAC|nr:hypothetical protein CDAR_299371 [Caerostris darwini]